MKFVLTFLVTASVLFSLELPDPLSAFGTELKTSQPRDVWNQFLKAQEEKETLTVLHTATWLLRNKIRVKPEWMAGYLLANQQTAMAVLVAYYYQIPQWASPKRLKTTEQSLHWFLEWMAFIHKIYSSQSPPSLPENPYCQAEILLSNGYEDAGREILSTLPEEPFGILNYLKIKAGIQKTDAQIARNLIFRGLLQNLGQVKETHKLDLQDLQDPYPLDSINLSGNTLEIFPTTTVALHRIQKYAAKIEETWFKTTELELNLKPLTILGITEFPEFYFKYDPQQNTLMISDKFWYLNQDRLWLLLKHHLALHQLMKNYTLPQEKEFLLHALAKTYAQIPPRFFGSSREEVLWPLSKSSLVELEPMPNQKTEFIVLQDLLTELGLFLFDPGLRKTVSHKIMQMSTDSVLLDRTLDQFYAKNFKKDLLTGY